MSRQPAVIGTRIEIIEGKEYTVVVFEDAERAIPPRTWGATRTNTSRPAMTKKQRQAAAKRQRDRERKML